MAVWYSAMLTSLSLKHSCDSYYADIYCNVYGLFDSQIRYRAYMVHGFWLRNCSVLKIKQRMHLSILFDLIHKFQVAIDKFQVQNYFIKF